MTHQTTTCPYCGVGCGIRARTGGGQLLAVAGDPGHPANHGRLCIKGSSLPETCNPEGRLLQPRVDGQSTDWNTALDTTASRLQAILKQHGPNSVAMYLSGQLLTEDYYVANKLMKGFIGSSHVDTNSRLCMASTVAGHKRAFGADAVPGCYEDLELADLLVLVGSNAAWNHPILYQRMQAAKQARQEMKVVVIDPRRTATCDLADLHLQLRPGTDALLFNALLVHLAEGGKLDHAFISDHTEGMTNTLLAAMEEAADLSKVASRCGLKLPQLLQFLDWFAETPRTVTLFSQGINQSSSGTDKVNAILNCHLATGRIGKPSSCPLSLTGQPNAMGGREVGGLANQLAAHMDFSDPVNISRVARFWQAPAIAKQEGYKTIPLFEAIERGEIKAVWIIGTNPLVSLPDSNRISKALADCELVIVSEAMQHTDTLALADIIFPASSWSEKNGTVTNSERRISRQRGLLPAPGEARHDWEIICQLAMRLGHGAAFAYRHPAEIFREHATLSGFENNGSRCFDISGLSQLSDEAYDQLQPVQWPVTRQHPLGTARLFADGQFFTASGKARFVAVHAREPEQQTSADWPLLLNTGRIRDQWHTMTRTGRAPRLMQHLSEPFVDIHPQDAEQLQLKEGQLARLSNPEGSYLARTRIRDSQRPGEVFVPMHWTAQFTGMGLCNSLIQQRVDPVSGQPESKQGRVSIQPVNSQWQARLLLRLPHKSTQGPDDLIGVLISDLIDGRTADWASYWAKVPMEQCTALLLADDQPVHDWNDWCRRHLGQAPQLLLQTPGQSGGLQAAGFDGEQLNWLLQVNPEGQFTDSTRLDRLFAKSGLSAADRRLLMQPDSAHASGPRICSCLQVHEQDIRTAIRSGCNSVEQLGQQLGCGTKCGSCIPELKSLIEAEVSHGFPALA